MAKKMGFAPKVEYQPKFCQDIVNHMASGFSFDSFGAVIGVHRVQMDRWTKYYPEFQEAKDLAFLKCLYFWEDKGIKGMHAGKDFNAAIWIFNMKNRFRHYGWTDTKEFMLPDGAEISKTTTIEELYSLETKRRKGIEVAKKVEKLALTQAKAED